MRAPSGSKRSARMEECKLESISPRGMEVRRERMEEKKPFTPI